jgi:tetratricopeptide (TPR) repeat protein
LALPLYDQTLRLRQARLGPDHPDTLGSMSNLASAYESSGKWDLALPLYEQTLNQQKIRLGIEHPNTLLTVRNLAQAYRQRKQFDKSIPLLKEWLKLVEKKLGRDHLQTLLIVMGLGVNYTDAGRVPEALPLLEEVYRARKAHPPLRLESAMFLMEAYMKAREQAKAVRVFREQRAETQLAQALQTLPAGSPQLAERLAQIGVLFLELQEWAGAEPLCRESLAIREKSQPNAWTTFNTMSMLGGALLGQKKYAEAEPLLLKGYEGMKAREKGIPPQGGIRIPEAIDRLIEFYTATGKLDEAKTWRAERAKYPELAPMPREKK